MNVNCFNWKIILTFFNLKVLEFRKRVGNIVKLVLSLSYSSYLLLLFLLDILNINSCDGRVVKALDLKSNGVSPRRFEPCSQRIFLHGTFLLFHAD